MLRSIRFLFIMCSCITWAISTSFAQSGTQPTIKLTVSADGKSVDAAKGISAQTQRFKLEGSLAPESANLFPNASPQITIPQAEISLVRDSRRVAFLHWTPDQSLTSLAQQAQPGDRYVIRVNEANLTLANGHSQRINKELVYSVKLL